MSTTPDQPSSEPSDEVVAAMISHIVDLQSRIDALNALVEVLASKSGIDLTLFRAKSKEIYDVCYQKRLEKIEDQSPEASAKIDRRGDMPPIDPDLLDDLRFGDGGKS